MIDIKDEMISVGIDIGTSTTQLVFSKLIIENMASSYSVPRIVITDKKVIYKSDIYFTPLLSQKQINSDAVREIVEKEYKKANIAKESIDTGAVIITGETARKENARDVLNSLSGFAGDFVVATAGADLESIISGKGAGADVYSREKRTGVVNIDIGGGTSNLAVFINGDVTDTGCMDIGGRLIKIDRDTKKITYITDKLQKIINDNSLNIAVGMVADENMLKPIIDIMVTALIQSVGLEEKDSVYDLLMTHKSISDDSRIKCVSFSGGVADCIYNDNHQDVFEYGDIGILLGRAIQKSRLCREFQVVKSRETIRATVVGAGTHTTEISGSTITYTQNVFPIKNVPVMKLLKSDENNLAESILKKIEWYKTESDIDKVAIAFEGQKNPSYNQIIMYAEQIVDGAKELLEKEFPLIIIVENDMAKALGQVLYSKLDYKKDVVCIDGIKLDNGDYIDIGRPIAEGNVLPVVIKTLVFN